MKNTLKSMVTKNLPLLNKIEYALLPISSKCDYDCIFCTSNYPGKPGKIKNNSLNSELFRIKGLLAIGRRLKLKKIFLSGDEPLAHPFIAQILNFSHKLGYEEVNLHTSGLKLGQKDTLDNILRLPLKFNFYIPIYGADARVHDRVVRKKGSFEALVSVLRALNKIRELNINLHSIVLKQNYCFLDDILGFCNYAFPRFFFDGFIHVKFHPFPKDINYKDLMVPYRNLFFKLKKSKEFLRGFPVCVLERFGKLNDASSELPFCIAFDKKVLNLDSYPNLYAKEVIIQNPPIDKCLDCKRRNSCIGPYKDYIDNFGVDDFTSIN
ncbi:MAG: radical SAM protein [Candidatus Omnitrophota bacterium]|nr:radical SAM protein [Candidatus Omnitrophota bacterium]